MNYLDMLAKLGAGSAHPGGYAATLKQLDTYGMPEGSRILEVGCGTGRTACLLAERGFCVTAVDLQPEMIRKATQRAEQLNLDVQFVRADIANLPFEDAAFDVVIAESVTNFAYVRHAVAEYARVLKSNGTLYDREIVRLEHLDEKECREISDFFGFLQLLDAEQWLEVMGAHFEETSVWDLSLFHGNSLDDAATHPDPLQQTSAGVFSNMTLLKTAIVYSELVDRYNGKLGSAVMIGRKRSG